MQLVIAEKPSVARDLARVLGVRATGRSQLQGAGQVISWCIGHLVELEEPAAYDARWKSWRLDTLPMVPRAFKLRPVAQTRDQLRIVCDLLRDRRFSEVVNACDAGREGELIFRYVYQLAGSRLPVRRLWISSLTDDAIRHGFAGLRPGGEYDALADAARCRSEADWLVGMNATRAVTLGFRASDESATPPQPAMRPARPTPAPRGRRSGRGPLPAVYSIGRVQTPTLAIVVRREQAIRAFVPRDYWEVRGTFVLAGHEAANDAPKESPDEAPSDPHKLTAQWMIRGGRHKGTVTRFGVRKLAEEVVARAGARAAARDPAGPVVESLIQKRSREPPPQLFDLTSLQRTANRRYGLSATQTLDAAQALYERHKLLTYPRTDSRHLPHDQAAELPRLFRGLAKIPTYASFAEPLIERDLAPAARSRRIFDDTKVHDHHAIIPTGKVAGAGTLGRDEERIFDLVVRRFLGAFHPDAEFALTEAVLRVGQSDAGGAAVATATATATAQATATVGSTAAAPQADLPDETLLAELPPPPDRFIARGRVRLVAGWQAVAGLDERRGAGRDARGAPDGDRGGGADGDATLPPLAQGQRLDGRFEAIGHQTRPPPRHTEATLLGAMELAGREIEDEALRAAMKDTGLGTPATRAATIETLVKRGFIGREGKQVVATPVGISLIERLPVPMLASPELTGAWEARLARISRGQETRSAFMTDIVRYVGEVTDALRGAPRPVGAPAPVVAEKPAKPTPGVVKAAAAPALACPRCRQGSLMTGKRGWGCTRWRDGCSFVIWFDVAGKRITGAQLRELVEKGKTRKGKWSPPGEGVVAGRLVLDLNATQERDGGGGAVFQPA
jgi:DNA topoisomerase-3